MVPLLLRKKSFKTHTRERLETTVWPTDGTRHRGYTTSLLLTNCVLACNDGVIAVSHLRLCYLGTTRSWTPSVQGMDRPATVALSRDDVLLVCGFLYAFHSLFQATTTNRSSPYRIHSSRRKISRIKSLLVIILILILCPAGPISCKRVCHNHLSALRHAITSV